MVPLARDYDEPGTVPQIDENVIWFNGVGDDGHETFALKPDGHGFDFCKTARKPYDVVVVATLAVVNALYPDIYRIGSDGDREDWAFGIGYAKYLFPEIAAKIDFPSEIRGD